ncbi:MAG: hypothetical protein M1128_02350 [Candidatus Marsarchaeota archaeon]|nr:hypothetical protein [Candidatus Marsarchaeota archaeon]
MSFEIMLFNAFKADGFNSKQFFLSFKDRAHISKSKLDADESTEYLNADESNTIMNRNEIGKRYISAMNVTYDLLFSVYEINSMSLFCARIFKSEDEVKRKLGVFIKRFKKPNFEVRIFGMQNNESPILIGRLLEVVKTYKLGVYEVDLFGDQTRNIAFDAKNGMSFNILMNDRIYRAGELKTNLTEDQFKAQLK